jgi:hypothetical protein
MTADDRDNQQAAGDPMTTDIKVVTPLRDDLALAVVRDIDGWRFDGWQAKAGTKPPSPPPISHLSRRFATVEAAVAFFVAFYGQLFL